jgi:hypothetical protein
MRVRGLAHAAGLLDPEAWVLGQGLAVQADLDLFGRGRPDHRELLAAAQRDVGLLGRGLEAAEARQRLQQRLVQCAQAGLVAAVNGVERIAGGASAGSAAAGGASPRSGSGLPSKPTTVLASP